MGRLVEASHSSGGNGTRQDRKLDGRAGSVPGVCWRRRAGPSHRSGRRRRATAQAAPEPPQQPETTAVGEIVTRADALADRKRRIVIPVRVAYGSNPREVVEILKRVADENQDVLSDPAPQAFFVGFGSSSLDFELKAFTDRDWVAVRSDLGLSLSEALVFAGITIPFSQHDLFLRNAREVGEGIGDALGTISRAPENPSED